MTRALTVCFSEVKSTTTQKKSFLSPKRTAEDENLHLPLSRITKRQNKNQNLFVNDYESLCAHMNELSHTPTGEVHASEIDLLLDALEGLGVEAVNFDWNLPLEDLLSLEWHTHIPPLTKARPNIRRAIRLCTNSGLTVYRDILWYNDTLPQAASLQKFPNCLVQMAYDLENWDPRKRRPQASLQEWTSAWQALTLAWPEILLTFPPDLRTSMLTPKHSAPPATANWFEFNFFDGYYDEMAPLLCYHEDPMKLADETATQPDNSDEVLEALLESTADWPTTLPSTTNSDHNAIMLTLKKYLGQIDDGYLSDQDPRKPRTKSLVESNADSDSEDDLFDA